MKFTLIRTEGAMIPGGYRFDDPITGKHYEDMHTLFAKRVRSDQLAEILCDTCSGHRVTGYKCKACGKETDP